MREDKSSSQPTQKFLSALSENLHQMAQPLSIVQATLELALLKPITAKHYREITKEALDQLRRAVEVLHFTGQLTRLQQPASDTAEVLLSQTVDEVIGDLHRVFEAAKIGLLTSRPGRECSLQVSGSRLRQMIFYVLQAAQGLSRPGDVVHVEVKARAGGCALCLHHSRRARRGPEADDIQVTRALALAEAIALNAGAKFNATVSPLLVMVDFAADRHRRTGSVSKLKPKAMAELQSASSQ